MKSYLEPEMIVVKIAELDIVTLSNPGTPGGNDGETFNPDLWT